MGRAFDPDLLLNRPLMAMLATVTSDGKPCIAPVWFAWEDNALWMLSNQDAHSISRIEERPDVSVEIVEFEAESGMLLHLGLRGRAEIRPMDEALFHRLLIRYLGPEDTWNPWFIENIARIQDPQGRLIRLEPESVFTNDSSYFRTGPDFASPSAE